MKKFKTSKKRLTFFIILFFTTAFIHLQGESVSFRLSYGSYSNDLGDINKWINSLNSLWSDWKNTVGGNLSGQFDNLNYKPRLEGELRIKIFSGLALSFAASYSSYREEGTVNYQSKDGNENATHFLFNEVKAIPLKAGISFSIPVYSRINVSVNAGRHIIFVSYSTQENYEYNFTGPGIDHWFKRDTEFHSESLGFYLSAGVEYELTKFLSIGIEGEKVWSKVDGFKGPYSFKDYKNTSQTGKASLYFYQKENPFLNQYYSYLEANKKRPEEPGLLDLRQGIFNFSGFSIKIGLRFKI